jgi:hypothetical protein
VFAARGNQLLKVPLRSLKRSSPCGALVLVAGAEVVVADATVADPTDVSDDALPHNSWIAGETGWLRSPAWNSERNAGRVGADALVVFAADAIVTGVAVTGKLDRKAALSIGAGVCAELATAVLAGMPPAAAIALSVADEPAALA